MKCLVHKCKNQNYQGNGYYLDVTEPSFGKVGQEWVCCPCWDTIVGQNQSPQHSQVYKNIKEIMFRSHPDVDEYYKDDYYPVIAEEDLNG